MRYLVSWNKVDGMEGKELEVDADTRWDAVVEAATGLGIEALAPMQQLFNLASVKSLERRRFREYRFEAQKELLSLLEDAQKPKSKKRTGLV